MDEVLGDGDDDDGGIDEPVRCLRRASALLMPSVLPCVYVHLQSTGSFACWVLCSVALLRQSSL